LTREELFSSIKKKNSYLCIGLDADIKKIPSHLLKFSDPIFEFNRRIIDATHNHCIAYKPNIAFYESLGVRGWESLQKTVSYIPKDIFTIADAKRGDIGNTSDLYARTFFDPNSSGMEFDAVTVAPYMGKDSVTPFLEYPNKWSIILAHTSNEGSRDFQTLTVGDKKLYQIVIEKTQQWGSADQIMYVVGATHPEAFKEIRQFAPDHFLLVPGVGAQGGDLEKISANGFNNKCGLIVNSSRGIIYASNGEDFDARAKKESLSIQEEMKTYLDKYVSHF
jgi:orotidine-5'-phosphate decarboxylase